MSNEEMKRAMEAILFAAGESVEITRIAQSLEINPKKAESLFQIRSNFPAFFKVKINSVPTPSVLITLIF